VVFAVDGGGSRTSTHSTLSADNSSSAFILFSCGPTYFTYCTAAAVTEILLEFKKNSSNKQSKIKNKNQF
jgi:hypothetical protein